MRRLLLINAIVWLGLGSVNAQDHLNPSTMRDDTTIVTTENIDGEGAVEDAIVYLKIGNQKIGQKDFKSAAEQYTRAIEIKHDFKEAIKNRGICYTMMDKDEMAIMDFDHAITIDPEDKSLYNYRGFAEAELKNYAGAEKDFEKALSMDPKYKDPYMNRGIMYIWMERYEDAIAQFNKVLDLEPNNGKAFYNRGIAYEEMGNIPRACMDWNKSLSLKYKLALTMVGTYCE